jgi:hypothetical protein
MAADKWATEATHLMLFLGYLIDSHSLMVTWPLYKQADLLQAIQEALTKPHMVSPLGCGILYGPCPGCR